MTVPPNPSRGKLYWPTVANWAGIETVVRLLSPTFHFHCGWLEFLPSSATTDTYRTAQSRVLPQEATIVPEFDVDAERITVFEIGGEYPFTHYFEPVVVEDPEQYCVLKEKFTPHADILRDSVVHWERRGHIFFLLKDERSVSAAVERGATRLEDTEFVLGI